MPVEIISKKNHPYAGRNRRPGDSYVATTDHAKFLVKAGFADYAPEKAAAAAVKKPVYESASMNAEIAEKPKRDYKRRDLTAEEDKS